MDDLPFGKPIFLRSFFGANLHNPHGLDRVLCINKQALYTSVILHCIGKDSVAIQAYRNGRFLAADDSGHSRFVSESIDSLPDKCKFYVEMRVIDKSSNHLFFVSQSMGRVLQSTPSGSVRFDNTNRLEWEAWSIVEFDGTEGQTAHLSDQDVPKSRLGWIKFLVEKGNSADEIRKILEIVYPTGSDAVPVAVASAKVSWD